MAMPRTGQPTCCTQWSSPAAGDPDASVAGSSTPAPSAAPARIRAGLSRIQPGAYLQRGALIELFPPETAAFRRIQLDAHGQPGANVGLDRIFRPGLAGFSRIHWDSARCLCSAGFLC